MRAIGLAAVQDTDQLVGGEAEIKVAVKQSDEYGPRNEVSATMPLAKGQLPQPVSASKPAMSAPAAAPSRAAPPWARKA
jgi:hypothetical protein